MLATTTFEIDIPHAWNTAVQEIQRVDANDKPRAGIERIFSVGYLAGNAVTTSPVAERSIAALGWTQAEALETYLRLRSFAENEDAPKMEAYDRDTVLTEFKPKTELGRRLLALRRSYLEQGGQLLDAEALSRELRERRGGIQHG